MRIFAFAALLTFGALGGIVAASAQSARHADEPYYQSGPWEVVELANAFCEIRWDSDAVGRLSLSKSSTEPAYFNFQLTDELDYDTPGRNVTWDFDGERVPGRLLVGKYYQIPDSTSQVEALFRKARTLTIIHDDKAVARVDLTGSAAAFRQLTRCADQFPGKTVPVIPPPAPPRSML
ncbi:MAG: hypothetical protein R3D99_05975 [Altererythrobacter sp.]